MPMSSQPMMRAARRASLLVAFYLLTSAATATAECAWVLWSETTTHSVSTPHCLGDQP